MLLVVIKAGLPGIDRVLPTARAHLAPVQSLTGILVESPSLWRQLRQVFPLTQLSTVCVAADAGISDIGPPQGSGGPLDISRW